MVDATHPLLYTTHIKQATGANEMNKQEQRKQLIKDIEAYLQTGGKVKQLKAKKVPENRKVT